ncbi:MAG: rhodanese-like domain-containing protein [Candidatus Saccharibacteria bacterium]
MKKHNTLLWFLMIAVMLLASMATVSGKQVFVGKAGADGKVLKKYIEPVELKKLVEHPVDSIWIVDVRSEKAYNNGHIPTAKSFPYGQLKDRLNEIPKDQYLILYCNVGATAKMASKILKKFGYRRWINWGGIPRWEWEKETAAAQ